MRFHTLAKITLPRAAALGAALALAACGSAEEEEVTYEAAVEDLSGGELIVVDPEEEGVPVTLPETPMTNVPPEELEALAPEEESAE